MLICQRTSRVLFRHSRINCLRRYVEKSYFILIGVAFAVLLSANLYVSHISGDEQILEQLR